MTEFTIENASKLELEQVAVTSLELGDVVIDDQLIIEPLLLIKQYGSGAGSIHYSTELGNYKLWDAWNLSTKQMETLRLKTDIDVLRLIKLVL